jgi:hypothetical protein
VEPEQFQRRTVIHTGRSASIYREHALDKNLCLGSLASLGIRTISYSALSASMGDTLAARLAGT